MARRALNGDGTVYRERSSWRGRIDIDGDVTVVRGDTRRECQEEIDDLTASNPQAVVLDLERVGRDRWVGQAYDVNRRRRKVTGRTREEAARRLEELQGHRKRGSAVPDPTMTFEALTERWSASQAGRARSQATREHDDWTTRTLVAEFGPDRLKALTVARCEDGMSNIAVGAHSRAPLSKLSARRVLAMLRRILGYAERLELIARNPADMLDASVFGEARNTRTTSLTAEQVSQLYEAVADEWICGYVRLGLFVGARPSELAALQWDSVNLDAGQIEIRRSRRKINGNRYEIVDALKTAGGRRVLDLPAGAVEMLRVQRAKVLEAQMASSDAWPHAELVFPSQNGTLLDPSNVRRELKRVCRAANLPEIGPNALRHSVASLLAEAGESPARVAHLLGHSTPATSLSFYTHRTSESSNAASGMTAYLA